jgi:uncharacterized damage-inducible protein DinB
MSEARAILAKLRQQRRAHDAELALLTQTELRAPVAFTWETMLTGQRGQTATAVARDMLLRRVDHLEEHALQIEELLRTRFGLPRTQTQRIWGACQQSRGDLLAALVGVTDADLDNTSPAAPDEWSLRQILEHVLVVERYYTMDTQYALARFRAGEPHGALPDDELQSERPGASLSDLLDELDQAREAALATLGDLGDAELRAPAMWGEVACDVRFLLMRCAHHEREHTDQIHKARELIGKPRSEAARLLGVCWQRSGLLEGLLVGAPDDALDRDPGDGDLPIRRLLAHIGSAEQFFKRMIEGRQ